MTMTLVSRNIKYVPIFAGIPQGGASNKGGVGKSCFLAICIDVLKMV